jgi:hypothetical protein
MTLTILTPTGSAMIKDSQSKAGYKALMELLHRMQIERVPFLVLPKGTSAHDLREITSIDNLEY